LIGQREFEIDESGNRRYRRVFQALVDTATVGGLEVFFASGLPRQWTPYIVQNEYDLGATVRTVKPRQTDTPFLWEIDVEYATGRISPEQADVGGGVAGQGSMPGGGGGQSDELSPLLRAPEIRWDTVPYERSVQVDLDGKSYINSAGVPYEEGLILDHSRLQLTIVRNEATFNSATALAYQDAVNSDTFYSHAAGTAKVAEFSGQSQWERGTFFWKVTYRVQFSRDDWLHRVLDQGMEERIDGKLERITDEDGKQLPRPVLLDGNGRTIVGWEEGDFFLREFRKYVELPFSVLNLPTG
jgi:hypothetical protein